MSLGLTRGEIILTTFIFALIYGAGLLPRIVNFLVRGDDEDGKPAPARRE